MSTSRPSATEASKAAKRLTGQWAHLRADNPSEFVESVAAILSRYPLALVDEIVNTRALALKVEYFSLKSLGAWLDERLEYYEGLAAWRPRALPPPELPDNPEMAARAMAIYNDLVAAFRDTNRSPLDMLLDQRAAMRRESIDRILGYAERVAPRAAE